MMIKKNVLFIDNLLIVLGIYIIYMNYDHILSIVLLLVRTTSFSEKIKEKKGKRVQWMDPRGSNSNAVDMAHAIYECM